MYYRHAFVEVVKELFGVGLSSPSVVRAEALKCASLAMLDTPLLAAPFAVTKESLAPTELSTHTEAYVVVREARLFLRPVHAFDTVIMTLPYATVVRVLRHEGRFSSVEHNGVVGFVHKDELVYTDQLIFPEFVPGEAYDAHHVSTQAVRRYLDDEFFTESLYLPLLAVEYVSYVLKRNGRKLMWPPQRPRKAGTWHTLLRGVRGVHVGLVPRTGAIIEYDVQDGESVLGYVEVVRPDGTLVVATVGRTEEGVFLRYEFTEALYHEARALFISVT